MNEDLEKMNGSVEGAADTDGQGLERPEDKEEVMKEKPEESAEQSPEQEISGTIGEINHIDQEIGAAQKSAAETENKLAALRNDMGVPGDGKISPAAEFQNDRIKELEQQKKELAERKEQWIAEYGRENIPDGLVLEDENGDLEAKDQALLEKEKKEDLEWRKKWLKEWERDAAKNFEEAIRGDWRSNDAMNLDLAIELMKLRIPKIMDEEFEDFINGTTEDPPFLTVWARWHASSAVDRLLDTPNQISKLEIYFDDEAYKIADEGELTKQKEEEDPKNPEGAEVSPTEKKAA